MIVLHVIASLRNGGAEKSLLRLIENDVSNTHYIFVLTSKNIFYKNLNNQKFKIFFSNSNIFLSYFKFRKIKKKINPTVIQSWMYHSNVFVLFASFDFYLKKKLFWNVRNNTLKNLKLSTKIIIYLNAFLSTLFKVKTVFPSNSACTFHKSFGFTNTIIIPNGYIAVSNKEFDLDIDISSIKFLMVSRWDKQKDFETLFKSFSKLKHTNWTLSIVGENISRSNSELINLIQNYQLSDKVHILDQDPNVENIYSQHNVHVLSSFTESFPNVVVESTLHGLLSLSSNVGDVSFILKNNKWIFPINNYEALLNTLNQVFKISQNNIIWNSEINLQYQHIVENFNITKTVNLYNKMWSC